MKYSITCSAANIEYTLTRKKVKGINIRINADGEVRVSAPPWIKRAEIEKFIVSKSRFILKAKQRMLERRRAARAPYSFIGGEIIYIRGRTYNLSLRKGESNGAHISGNLLVLETKKDENELKKKTFVKWLRAYAYEVYNGFLSEAYSALRLREPFPEIKIRRMTSRWGSCNIGKRIITMNLSLIEAPDECIRYVTFHEMCHLVYPNHGRDFHLLMNSLIPDNKEIKKRLNESVVLK